MPAQKMALSTLPSRLFISSSASANSSSVGQQVTLMVPMPPALQTAAASCGTASHCMPLCTMGVFYAKQFGKFCFHLFFLLKNVVYLLTIKNISKSPRHPQQYSRLIFHFLQALLLEDTHKDPAITELETHRLTRSIQYNYMQKTTGSLCLLFLELF